MYANKKGRCNAMSLAREIESIAKDMPADLFLYEESDLIKDYQTMLDKGLIKRRGYTLQTIEEKQKDALKVQVTYSIN